MVTYYLKWPQFHQSCHVGHYRADDDDGDDDDDDEDDVARNVGGAHNQNFGDLKWFQCWKFF